MGKMERLGRWTLFLAEVEGNPGEGFPRKFPGVFSFGERTWLWPDRLSPDEERKLHLFAESPLYGKVYARVVASGDDLEALRSHPLFPIGKARLLNKYLTRLQRGELSAAREIAALAGALGLEEELAQAEEKAQAVLAIQGTLAAAGAPFEVREGGEVWVGSPGVFRVSSLEEAQLVAETYRWSRTHRVPIYPAPRGGKGEIRFYAELTIAKVKDGEAALPLARPARGEGKRIVAFRRQGGLTVAEEVPLRVPKEVSLIFLPHRNL